MDFFIEIIEETRKINNVSYPQKIYEFGTLPTKPPKKNFISEDMNNDSLTYDDGDDFQVFINLCLTSRDFHSFWKCSQRKLS